MKLNKEFIEKVSKSKGEPEWMLEFRLKSFEMFLELDNPSFGPKLDIDFDKINYYKKISDVTDSWDNVDKDIKKTFDDLGVIKAENTYLCGVSNQIESEVFYHKLNSNNGVIFLSTDEALKEYPGTILFISHDRYFINEIAQKILYIEDKGITEYLGNYDDYRDTKEKQLSLTKGRNR